MPDLAACYFCGAALDEPLSDVRLGEAADAPTVTLCPGCKEKLESIFEAVDRGSANPSRETSEMDSEAPPATSEATEADPAPAAEVGEAPAGESASSAADDAAADADAEADDGGTDDGGTDEERSIVEGDQEISALEYNKVMRLLQNREFPVDREEIVTVAANAYQVARADCDRVIDVAIDRGLIDEDDGQLVRPD